MQFFSQSDRAILTKRFAGFSISSKRIGFLVGVLIFIGFAFVTPTKAQSSLENCAGYSVLSLTNEANLIRSVNITLNGKVEILTVAPSEAKLFKVKGEAW